MTPIAQPQPAAVLLEVNAQLVQEILRAHTEAEDIARSSREVSRLAGLDPLTKLPTRMLLVDRFVQAAAMAHRHSGRLAILFVDLDDFKLINDIAGHAAGDEALEQVARCLQESVRAADTVSRHGGDEFLVLLTEVVHASDAALIAAKMISALAAIDTKDGPLAKLTASIGISMYPDDGEDLQSLIGLSDAAMYRAKQSGRGRFRFHSEIADLPVIDVPAATRPPRAQKDKEDRLQSHLRLNTELRDTNEVLLLSALREIDDRRRAENRLQIALDAAGMGSWELDLKTGAATCSLRHYQIFGYPAARPSWDLAAALGQFVAEDRASVGAAFDAARITGHLDFERRIHRAGDDSIRWLHMKGQTFYENGEPVVIAGVVADVTDRRAFEDRSRQAQKMEAIGQLTGGIAHDFNNLLLVIGGSLELLARRLPVDERTARLLDSARRGLANGSKLNQQLLAFARRQDLQPEVIAIQTLMPVFEQLLQRAAGESIFVETRCDEEPWPCFIDPHQLDVAILNLAINARDAMPDGGTLTLQATNRAVTDDYARRWGAVGGDFVTISIADTGAGMPDAVIERAFEPFFTTKPVGKGTGLGLSQVYGFAQQSGGFVSIERGAKVGTIATIHLPRTRRVEAEPIVASAVAAPLERGAGVVLVVEDNAEVRAIARAMLADLHYSVVEAETADAAMAIIADGVPINIVFSDVIMPGISGIDLAVQLRRRSPDLPVLLTSGYTAQQVIPADLAGRLRLLRKPYTQADLAAAMLLALAGPSRHGAH